MIHGSYDARSWKSLGGISHKDDKWLLHFSLLLLGLCRTRHCVIDDSRIWDDLCQENPNDPVVLHNLGVALTEEGDGNWQRLLWTKSGRYCQPPCLQADTRKLRRNSFKLGSCKRKLARPWLSGDCLMIHGASCLVAAAQVNYATMFGLATVLTEQGAFGGNWIHSKSCLECSCDGPTNQTEFLCSYSWFSAGIKDHPFDCTFNSQYQWGWNVFHIFFRKFAGESGKLLQAEAQYFSTVAVCYDIYQNLWFWYCHSHKWNVWESGIQSPVQKLFLHSFKASQTYNKSSDFLLPHPLALSYPLNLLNWTVFSEIGINTK